MNVETIKAIGEYIVTPLCFVWCMWILFTKG